MKRIGIMTAGLLCLAAHAGLSWGSSAEQGLNAPDSATTALDRAKTSKGPDAVPVRVTGWVPEEDPSVGKPSKPVEFVSIEGGGHDGDHQRR